MRVKAESVTLEGEPDGWQPAPGFQVEMDPGTGTTRLTISVPPARLASAHLALVQALARPLSVLYRRVVDRMNHTAGARPVDFVAVNLDVERVVTALGAASSLVYGDARCEVWVRGGMSEQLVLDADGVLFVYPDDPAFRDVLAAQGIAECEFQTLLERDYVKHWYHADNDAREVALIAALGLQGGA